jgi:diaminopimelate epimerase
VISFVKSHGAGNDFVLVADFDDELALEPDLVRALCDRHLGLGADGVIRLAPPDPGVDAAVFMDYRNADGTLAEMCGNGVRCVAKYLADRGYVAGDAVHVATRSGVKQVEITERHRDGRVAAARVDMGAPEPGEVAAVLGPGQADSIEGQKGLGKHLGVARETVMDSVPVTTLSMGNPHAVVVVGDITEAPVEMVGPRMQRHEAFPDGTNVEFIFVPARDRVVGRIWERGVGETVASGTGASAMVVAANMLDLADRRVTVDVPGGRLWADWTGETLLLTGPAEEVATGELMEAWVADRVPGRRRQLVP